MDDQIQSNIQNICKEFVRDFQGFLSWQWEDRFQTVLAVFNSSNKEYIHKILNQHLTHSWDSSTITNSDEVTRDLIKKFNNLKDGQLLFTSDTKTDGFVFALWWPWGSGENISIRIAPSFNEISKPDHLEMIRELKSWFQIT